MAANKVAGSRPTPLVNIRKVGVAVCDGTTESTDDRHIEDNPMNSYQVILVICMAAGSLAPVQAADQPEVQLEGQPNFRDLGGYKTTDGRTVKFGQLFRSGELSRLNDDDVRKLQQLGIKTVVNFLTDEEIKAGGEDRLPDNVTMMRLPIG